MAKKCFLYLLQVILRKSKRNFFYALLLSFPIFALLLIGFLLNSCLYILYRTVSILQSFKSSLLAEDRVFKTLFLSFYSEVPITTTEAEFLYPVRLGHTNQTLPGFMSDWKFVLNAEILFTVGKPHVKWSILNRWTCTVRKFSLWSEMLFIVGKPQQLIIIIKPVELHC